MDAIYVGRALPLANMELSRKEEIQAVIDPVICVDCGLCAENCPFQAIESDEEKESGLTITIAGFSNRNHLS